MATAEIVSIIIAVLSVFISPTLIITILNHKWAKQDKESNLVTKDDLKVLLEPFDNKLTEIQEILGLHTHGLQAELRLSIREECRKCIRRGYKTEEDITAVQHAYQIYEKLGPNHVTTALVDDFNKLPLELDRPETNFDAELERLKRVLDITKNQLNSMENNIERFDTNMNKMQHEIDELKDIKK